MALTQGTPGGSNFRIRWRGYDRQQVDMWVQQVNATWPTPQPVADPIDTASQQIADVLRGLAQIVADSEAQAAAALEDARARAAGEIAAAHATAATIIAEAEEKRHAIELEAATALENAKANAEAIRDITATAMQSQLEQIRRYKAETRASLDRLPLQVRDIRVAVDAIDAMDAPIDTRDIDDLPPPPAPTHAPTHAPIDPRELAELADVTTSSTQAPIDLAWP